MLQTLDIHSSDGENYNDLAMIFDFVLYREI